jgi:hypothetical protein
MKTLTSKTKNDYSEETICRITDLFEKGNEGKSENMGYYIIDTTGSKQVYFTLYRFKKSNSEYVNPFTYVKNVTSDFQKLEEMVHKFNSQPIPVIVVGSNNNNAKVREFKGRMIGATPVLKFGKYMGKTIETIWNLDKNYVLWFSKNFQPKNNANDYTLYHSAIEYANLFYTELTQTNRDTDTSKYIGSIKDKVTIEAKVTSIKANEDYTIINLVTIDGDSVYIYDKSYNLSVGEAITIIGTITKHIEKVGKKFTYLNRIKITKTTK